MDTAAIIELISSQGFPIVMCIIFMFYIWNRDEKMMTAFDRMTDAFIEFKSTIELLFDRRGKGGDK